jgi:RNA polymerase sigma factor (sigma-70 family)
VFERLFPVVRAAVAGKVPDALSGDIEDVAIIALEKVVRALPKCSWVKTADHLTALATSIAYDEACDLRRRAHAAIRGGGRVESLDAQDAKEIPADDGHSPTERHVAMTERALFLVQLREELKPQWRVVLEDIFLSGASYAEIAVKRGMPIGSVGVFRQRGLDAMRRLLQRRPLLAREARALARITDWLLCAPIP